MISPLGLSLGGPSGDVVDRRWMMVSEPDQDDPMEGRVRVPVPAAVQPVPRGLAGGRLNRRDPGQLGERGLRAQAPGVVPGREQQRTRGVGPGAEDAEQRWAGLRREPAELLVELTHLGAQGLVPSGEGSKRDLHRIDRTRELARTKTGAGAHQPWPRQPS
jgi:hypothetical protein